MAIQYDSGVAVVDVDPSYDGGRGTVLPDQVWYDAGDRVVLVWARQWCLPLGLAQQSALGLTWTGAWRVPTEFVAGGGEAWVRQVRFTIANQCLIWTSTTKTGDPSRPGPRLAVAWELNGEAIVVSRDGSGDLGIKGPASAGIDPDASEPYSWIDDGINSWIAGYNAASARQRASTQMCMALGDLVGSATERLGFRTDWPDLLSGVLVSAAATERLGFRTDWPDLLSHPVPAAATERLGFRTDWSPLLSHTVRAAATERLGFRTDWSPLLSGGIVPAAATERLGFRTDWPDLLSGVLVQAAATERLGFRTDWPAIPADPASYTGVVYGPPTWTLPASPVSVPLGESRSFDLDPMDPAGGSASVDLVTELAVDAPIRVSLDDGVMTIERIAEGDQGLKMRVRSDVTSLERTATLTVNAVMRPTLAAPASVTVEANEQIAGALIVSWDRVGMDTDGTAVPDHLSVLNYELQRSRDAGANWTGVPVAARQNIVDDGPLAAGSYVYRARAVAAGYLPSAWRRSGVWVQSGAAPPRVPGAFSAVRAGAAVTLSWTAPTHRTDGRPITGTLRYEVRRAVGGEIQPDWDDDWKTGLGTTMTADAVSTTVAESYRYQVRAVEDGRAGDWSAVQRIDVTVGPVVYGPPTWTLPASPVSVQVGESRSFDLDPMDPAGGDVALDVVTQLAVDAPIRVTIVDEVLTIQRVATGNVDVSIRATSSVSGRRAIAVLRIIVEGRLPAPAFLSSALRRSGVEVSVIRRFAAPERVWPGESVQVDWEVEGARAVTLVVDEEGDGPVPPPATTTNTDTIYRRGTTTPARPTGGTNSETHLPSGASRTRPSPTATQNVYSSSRTRTYTGGTFASATAWGSWVKVADKTTTPLAAPGAVRGLGESSKGTTSILWAWSAPATGGAVASYEYRTAKGSAAFSGNWVSTGATRSANVTGLDAGTSYRIQVRARNAAGAGTAATDSATTNAAPTTTTVERFRGELGSLVGLFGSQFEAAIDGRNYGGSIGVLAPLANANYTTLGALFAAAATHLRTIGDENIGFAARWAWDACADRIYGGNIFGTTGDEDDGNSSDMATCDEIERAWDAI